MLFTIFGATGLIGSHLQEALLRLGHRCLAPTRGVVPVDEDLGHVFYCIGLTADFRTRLAATVEAHVCHLMRVLTTCRYTRLCYLSSTRLYKGQSKGEEYSPFFVQPNDESDLYNISKLMGESATLHIGPRNVVVRISNVFCPDDTSDNFLASVMREATRNGKVHLRTTLDSSKDYVLIDDVVDMLPKILVEGNQQTYNLASGHATTHAQIMKTLRCTIEVAPNSPTEAFPPVSIDRLRTEFGYAPRPVLPAISAAMRSMPAPKS